MKNFDYLRIITLFRSFLVRWWYCWFLSAKGRDGKRAH